MLRGVSRQRCGRNACALPPPRSPARTYPLHNACPSLGTTRGDILAAAWDPEEATLAGGAGEAAAKAGLTGWIRSCQQVRPSKRGRQGPCLDRWIAVSAALSAVGPPPPLSRRCHPAHAPQQSLGPKGVRVSLVAIKGCREDELCEAAEAFLLPFRLSPNCAPERLTVGTGAGWTAQREMPAALPGPEQQQTAAEGEVKGAYGGVVAATGARLVRGECSLGTAAALPQLQRRAAPGGSGWRGTGAAAARCCRPPATAAHRC